MDIPVNAEHLLLGVYAAQTLERATLLESPYFATRDHTVVLPITAMING